MEKLNLQKESVIEVLRLIDKKMAEVFASSLLSPDKTTIVNFSIDFYAHGTKVNGNVYFEQIGKVKA